MMTNRLDEALVLFGEAELVDVPESGLAHVYVVAGGRGRVVAIGHNTDRPRLGGALLPLRLPRLPLLLIRGGHCTCHSTSNVVIHNAQPGATTIILVRALQGS